MDNFPNPNGCWIGIHDYVEDETQPDIRALTLFTCNRCGKKKRQVNNWFRYLIGKLRGRW